MVDPMLRIKNLERQVERLKKELVTDELTQILNRRGLLEMLEIMSREVRFTLSNPQKRKNIIISALSIIFIDIDYFKKVNTQYGHEGGDAALKVVAKTIKNQLRGIDIVGRYGGEEIVVGLVGADKESAGRIAENLRNVIEQTKIPYGNNSFNVTISCGVASLTANMSTPQILKKADDALYKAKNTGRNKVIIAN